MDPGMGLGMRLEVDPGMGLGMRPEVDPGMGLGMSLPSLTFGAESCFLGKGEEGDEPPLVHQTEGSLDVSSTWGDDYKGCSL